MAEGTLGVGTEDQPVPEPQDQITPQELARMIREVPNPEVDSLEFTFEDNPKKKAESYIADLSKDGSIVVASNNGPRLMEHCPDCGQSVDNVTIELTKANNPNDIEFRGVDIGFVRPTVKEKPEGIIVYASIPGTSLHQMETHGEFGGVNPDQVIALIKGEQGST